MSYKSQLKSATAYTKTLPPSICPSLSHLTYKDYEHVYEPADDTFLLLDALEADVERSWLSIAKFREKGSRDSSGKCEPRVIRTLELGVGSGVNTVKIAQLLSKFVTSSCSVECSGTDINTTALSTAVSTINANGFMDVRVNGDAVSSTTASPASPLPQPSFLLQHTDLCGSPPNSDPSKRWYRHPGFDFLIFNPPYVPTPQDEVGVFSSSSSSPQTSASGIEASWAGGENGRYVIDRALPEIKECMKVGGVVYMVVVDDNLPDDIVEVMQGLGFAEGSVFLRRQARNEFLSVLRFCKY